MNTQYLSRKEGILVLSGGLTVHNVRDMTSFSPSTAKPVYTEFNDAIMAAIVVPDVRHLHLSATNDIFSRVSGGRT